jgi:threonine synthase
MARGAGVFGEPAAVSGLAGLRKAVAQGMVASNQSVVLLVTGNGLKDIASVIKVTGEPQRIPADPAQLHRLFAP